MQVTAEHSGLPLTSVQRERRVLEQIAAGVPLAQVLEELLRAVEQQGDHQFLASILFVSEDGLHLEHGAAPSLPSAYNAAIDGIVIGEGVGSCGTAVSRGKPVYADDIASDLLWRDFKELALSHDLRACWSTPIKAADGKILGTFAVYYPVPKAPTQDDLESIALFTQTAALAIERHVSERDLRRSKERLTNAISVARLGAYEWNTTTGDVDMDARARTMFGLPALGRLRQEEIFERIDVDAFETVFARALGGLQASQRVEVDYALKPVDGVVRIVRSLGDVVVDGAGHRRMVGVFHDITMERQVEETLRAERALLERQVEARTAERDRLWRNSQDLLVIAGADTVLRATNGAWKVLLGWEESELVGSSFTSLIHPDDLEETLRVFGTITQAPLVEPYAYRMQRRDGAYRYVAWTAAFEGEEVYANGRDITAAHEQEQALAQAEAALRQAQKMEAVGQLTGGLAHDFNNLLAGISGSLEFVESRLSQGRVKEIDRYVTAARGAVQRAAALTHRLLAFSRRQTLAPKPTNVNRLVTGMEELIRRSIGPSVSLEFVGASGLWAALVDPSQLENALLNLCINARDAMPAGGKITVETANKWLDRWASKKHDLPEGQYLSLCVTDTGSGMSPELIERVFEPFFTTKPIGEGTGLGLSMIYGFARQSGGQVRIYSEVGQGTTVCIYLPRFLGEDETEEELLARVLPPSSNLGETVLVIDDEPTVRMLLVDILEELGYTPIEAGDGHAGLKILQSGVRIDLLITDVGLPGGLNGRQVADAARALRSELKVLFITGYAENAVLNSGHLAPNMAVITKPFAVDAMAAKIREMISERWVF